MKIHTLFLLLVLIGCQKTKPTDAAAPIAEIIEPQETLEVTNDEKIIKTDTVSIYTDGTESSTDYILAHLVNQEADKDSIVTVKYRLDFYQNKSKTASSKIAIKGFQKGSEWMASYGLTSESSKNSPFIQISLGYPACGYSHDHYLYYLKNSALQLVHQWSTMTDSGWGSWVEIENPSTYSDPKSFYCKTVAFVPADEDENVDMGILTHSDSISFELKDSKWKKMLLSVKDKPYFEKKMTFDQFNSVE
ncbi:MAG: hypothetical protein REI96_01595 [Flavobacterium nitrogenifigens]|uniref:Uncharacterized protein n=1 Tax=Flavobacterium nitrogenifigens TaxID=1617283 RepID=A0A521CXH2_9FLAO|nr:hypothetical protein [Flavobacterium nitrogenifigens]KAF2332109.1 hypothetical protein DM397_11290 [Flavobacterium nitrogenifigens]MDQ8011113.1 hypothetical protein [Flavobacterium nitrogenifigens]SMO64147.1 hypothetical protein SAMN06265220_102782 [Flavobacterium nitrogenifigens]